MSADLSNEQPILLSAHNLTCIRENRLLFEQLSFTVASGDIIQIAGPNGAGKTSLLRLLAGLSRPYEGQIEFDGQDINKTSDHYHQQLLYLGHTPGVKAELSAEENLSFNLAVHGMRHEQKVTEHALTQVNLLGFEDALASHLSAGQHRRIALARLWETNAKVWILDEPFTAIDKQGVKKLEQLFVKHAQNGGCVILTTHQELSLAPSSYRQIQLEYRTY